MRQNTNGIIESRLQYKYTLNISFGFIVNLLIEPVSLNPRLNGATYRKFLENELPRLLEEVLLELKNSMFFRHDDALALVVKLVSG